MFQVDETAEAVEGLLYHRTATAHDVEKLLGTLRCGHWPKAATDAACHNYKMVCHISSCSKNIVCRWFQILDTYFYSVVQFCVQR